AADERAPVLAARARDAADDLLRDGGGQPAGGEVVEKEQRLGALDEDVVDAVVDEVGADRVVAPGHERHLQLRADAVGARYEHRILKVVAIEAEQPAERSDLGQHAGGERRPRERLDAADGFVAGVDVDARLAVIHQKSSLPMIVCIRARRGDPSPDSQYVRRASAKKRSLSRSSSSMSKPSASSDSEASRWSSFSSSDSISGVLRNAMVPSASATGARRKSSFAGMPMSNSSAAASACPATPSAPSPAAAPRRSSW